MMTGEKPTIQDKVDLMNTLEANGRDGIYRWAGGQLEYLGASLLESTIKDDDIMAAAWDEYFRTRYQKVLMEVAARREHVWISATTVYACATCGDTQPMEPGYPRDGQCPGKAPVAAAPLADTDPIPYLPGEPTVIDLGHEAAELSVDLARLAAQPDDESEQNR